MHFGDRLQSSFAQVFGDIVPALLGALVILFAGYLLAKVLEKLIERFLRRIRLNQMLERGGVMQARRALGVAREPDARAGEPRLLARDVRRDPRRGERAGARVAGERLLRARELHPERDRGDRDHPRRHRARRLRGRADRGVGGRAARRPRAGARGARRGHPAGDLHGAPGARHRDRHRDHGVRDPLRCDRAGDGARRSGSATASSPAR